MNMKRIAVSTAIVLAVLAVRRIVVQNNVPVIGGLLNQYT